MFGGQVGVAGHATIADRTQAGAQSGIPNSVKKPGTTIMGYPAIDYRNFWKSSAVFKTLPELDKQIFQMQKELDELKKRLENRD
jgi:UDP-3-O-[3-hydroxymyristoyl] glucosamine N-acyltransferase